MATKNQLARLSPENAAKVLKTLKQRNAMIKKNADEVGERLAGMAVAAGTSFGLGYLMGSKESDYQAALQKKMDEEALSLEDAEKKVAEEGDPRLLFGIIPYDGAVALGLFGLALFPSKKRRLLPGAATYVEGAAFGALGAFMGRWGSEMAIESAVKEEE